LFGSACFRLSHIASRMNNARRIGIRPGVYAVK
jgi:hypothetical protein